MAMCENVSGFFSLLVDEIYYGMDGMCVGVSFHIHIHIVHFMGRFILFFAVVLCVWPMMVCSIVWDSYQQKNKT